MANQPSLTESGKLAGIIVGVIGLFLIATSNFYPLNFASVFDTKRILQLFLIAFCVVFATCWRPLRLQTLRQFSQLSTVNRIILTLFFSIGIISSLRLPHPIYALLDVSMLYLLAVMIVVTAASRDLAPELFDKIAVTIVGILGLAVFLQELMGFIVGWVVGDEFNYNQALMHFGHPRFYNQLQTWFIPLIAAMPLVFPKKNWLKPACIVLLGLQWFLVITLAARGTAISLLVAGLFVAFWLPNSRRFWLKTNLLGLALGIAIYCFFLFLNSLFIPQSESGAFYANSAGRSMMHTSGRTKFWQYSIKDAVENPWLGSGPANFACEHISWPAHTHNFPLQILGEWGIPAVILVLAFGVLLGFKFLQSLALKNIEKSADLPLTSTVAASLLAGLTHACLSGVLIMPASQTAFTLIGGWTLSLLAIHPRSYKIATRQKLLLTGSSLIVVGVLFIALSELKQLPERTSYTETHGGMMPRFWQDGKTCEYSY